MDQRQKLRFTILQKLLKKKLNIESQAINIIGFFRNCWKKWIMINTAKTAHIKFAIFIMIQKKTMLFDFQYQSLILKKNCG